MKRSRLKPRSAKAIAAAPAKALVRELVFARDCRCVLATYRWTPKCWGAPLTYHHLKKASAGGHYTVSNGVTLCQGCNGWVEDYPSEARALGLVVCHEVSADEARDRRRAHGIGPWDLEPGGDTGSAA